MFFNKDRYINEGVAEAVSYYCFDYEDVFTTHRERLADVKEEDMENFREYVEARDE